MQLESLKLRLGPGVVCSDLPYSASEGTVCAPMESGGIGGPINPGAFIHEFLPLGAEAVSGNLMAPWELEEGELYEIVFTTKMCLVRYRVGDIVRCSGFLHKCPLIQFHSRAAREISLGVATLSEGQVIEALRRCNRAVRGQWVFGPNDMGDGMRLYTMIPTDDGNELARQLDLELCELNASYQDCRRLGGIAPLTLAVLPEDHPLWKARAPKHGQQKPTVLWQQPIQAYAGEQEATISPVGAGG
jgi:hypothetical protein